MPCLIEESKTTIYFLRMSFRKSLLAIIAFACNAKTIVTFTWTGLLNWGVHYKKIELCFVGKAPVKFHTSCFFT